MKPLHEPRAANDERRWLHRYAVLVACCTFGLILVGSTVTTTGSGLAVPDWPTTYGQNMFTYPPSKWVGGVFYEHGHRLAAATVGLLTIGLCAGLWCSTRPRWLKWLGTLALATVCGQGLLGGLTVLLKLPPVVSVAHAALAQFFFCLAIAIAYATRRTTAGETTAAAQEFRPALAVLLCIYAQILAGALVRHTQSGLAVTDFPLCYGRLIPPTSAAALEPINEQRFWEEALPPVTVAQTWIHFGHRLGAVVVALAILLGMRRVLRSASPDPRLVGLAMLLLALLAAQIVLGALTIWTQRSLAVTTAHVGIGALMLGAAWGAVLVTAEGRWRPGPAGVRLLGRDAHRHRHSGESRNPGPAVYTRAGSKPAPTTFDPRSGRRPA